MVADRVDRQPEVFQQAAFGSAILIVGQGFGHLEAVTPAAPFDPVEFIRRFPDRIYHVHMKDAIVKHDGRNGILSSHLNFGDHRRAWDFRSLGRGGVNFEEIIRALNDIGYQGPLSVEWEDSGMDRLFGAREACQFVRRLDFAPSRVAFDAAFEKG